MIKLEDVMWAMSQKPAVYFACAMCEHFWWGVDQGYNGCKAHVTNTPCGGPLAGLAYPEYKGPLEGHLDDWCFVCGKRSTHLADVPLQGSVGVCEDHLEVLQNFSKAGVAPPILKPIPLDIRQ